MNLPTDPERDIEKNSFDANGSLDVVQAMIQVAYRTAVDPDNFEELLETWDAFYAKAASSANFLLLAEHFEQATAIAADPKLDRSRDLPVILDLVTAPAILVDKDGTFLMGNSRGQALLPDVTAGDALCGQLNGAWRPESEGETPHFQFMTSNGDALMASSRLIPMPDKIDARYLIMFEAAGWSEALTETLRDSYQLTDAEIAVAQLLHEGQSAVEIAEARGRSLETIRTQIKSILVKTETRKQSGFIQFLSHLQYVVGGKRPQIGKIGKPQIDQTGYEVSQLTMPCGRRLDVARYGDPDGQPMVYFTTSSHPAETPDWRKAVATAGLNVIAPFRPGFSGSDAVGGWDEIGAHLATACETSFDLDPATPTVFVGHREGGILAADVAARVMSKLSIAKVVLISTGAPGGKLPTQSMTRNSRALKSMPVALRLGYRAARRIYDSGEVGSQQIVSFFVKDSPRDQMLMKDPYYNRILHGNIGYCFQNTDMIVEDVACWTSNWADAIRKKGPQPHWHFIHGDAH
ncbi:MAG: hypothetical protein AAFU41_19030, partial [Pseudomonadota bacterium]